MRLNFRKIILPGFALLVALLIADSGPVSAQDREPHKTGLREPTARDEALIKKRWLKIKKVRPNPIGLQRINKARLKKGRESFFSLHCFVLGIDCKNPTFKPRGKQVPEYHSTDRIFPVAGAEECDCSRCE